MSNHKYIVTFYVDDILFYFRDLLILIDYTYVIHVSGELEGREELLLVTWLCS